MTIKIIPRTLLKYSRILRKDHNPWEIKLWQHLRAKRFFGYKFKRQVVIYNYIVDFSCLEKKLIIELDGSGHAESKQQYKDNQKEQFLIRQGYRVLHVWNNQLDENMQGVLEKIKQHLN